MADSLMDIRDHGICVGEKKKRRAKCNYCGKEVYSFSRLKYHLGGVGPDVTPCEQVTLDVREVFRSMVMEGKSNLNAAQRAGNRQTPRLAAAKVVGKVHKPGLTACERVGEAHMGKGHKRGRIQDSSGPENGNTRVEADQQDLLSKKAQKNIARFFYENCLDFSAVESPSFKEMLLAKIVGGGQMQHKFPDVHDLKGWMLQEELKEVQDHVKKIEDSWQITGCSILLDAWVDVKGRDLVSFIADSQAGAVYLKSVDVSGIKNNVTALISVVDRVVEEIGVHNVIQIIACSTSGWVGELGKSFAGSSRTIFWSVSVSHCFELMLERIGKSDSFRNILDKVTNISEFINKDPSVLKVLRNFGHGIDLTVSSSGFDFFMPYVTLESILNAKNDLAAMAFASGWNNEEAITISKVVKDFLFWESVDRVVKSTYPLIRGLLLFSGANNQHVGYIYDIMDGIKENIAKEFNHEESCYKLIWDVVDDVWNNHLHSPLHVSGYFLNPSAFYSKDFCSDPEVTTGLITTLFRLVKDYDIGAKVSEQLVKYTQGKGCFDKASQADQYTDIPPAEWWAEKASQHPELQSVAIKILSQTCEGASRYKLKRNLAEKLLFSEGMSHGEQKHVEELAFVHYNLHLQSFKAKLNEAE